MDDVNAFAEQIDGDDVGENGAVDPGFVDEAEAQATEQENIPEDPQATIKKRLGMQAKKHAREMRMMQEQLMHFQNQLEANSANPEHYGNQPSFSSPGQPNPPSMSEEDRIQHAVRMALGMKDQEERQAKDAERQAHVHKQYQRLNDEFDNASEKYDDFDDVVRGSDVPFTPHVRDALLLVENPAEVAYKLGKNKAELERISKLHPLDQAREVNKLSFSLMGGNSGKPQNSTKASPLGSIRTNPAHSSTAVTGKTPPSVIRARMKAGTWK